MGTWRAVCEDGCPSSRGLAVDEALVTSVGRGGPATLHLYSFKPSVIVGRFQDIDSEVMVDECRRLGIEINRRTTGGGAILMSEGCLGLALVAPMARLGLQEHQDAVFSKFGAVLSDALKEIGIPASYRPKNDIEVRGRKIAGIGADLEHQGILLFHASTLVYFDVDLMLRVLNLPMIKFSDKAVASFKDRLTTVETESGHRSLDAVREAILSAFSSHFGAEFLRTGLDPDELSTVDELVESRYGSDEWIYSVRAPKHSGQAAFKTPAGLVRVSVAISKGIISSALIHGDFFASGQDVFNIEACLKWRPLNLKSIKMALEACGSPLLGRIGLDELTQAVYDAGMSQRSEGGE